MMSDSLADGRASASRGFSVNPSPSLLAITVTGKVIAVLTTHPQAAFKMSTRLRATCELNLGP
jgi:hypothetical protein